jgi:cytochrome bd-type quinol oxidase subunit 2
MIFAYFLLDRPALFALALLVSIYLVQELGLRISHWMAANREDSLHEEMVNARDALRILLSLLLGFTLAMVLPRFDERRQVMVQEANSIGTTYLRAFLLPEPERSRTSTLMKEYADTRLAYAKVPIFSSEFQAAAVRTGQLQRQLWEQALQASKDSPNLNFSLFTNSLNDTIDMSEKRLSSRENRIPLAVWLMLLLISFMTSFATGYSAKRRVWLAMIATPLMVAIVMGLSADMDNSRAGFIRTDLRSLERVQKQIESGSMVPTLSAPTPGKASN